MVEPVDPGVLLAQVLATSGCAVVVLSQDLRIREWNRGAERIFGWPSEDARGLDYLEFLLPEMRAEIPKRVAGVLAGEAPTDFVVPTLTRSGKLRHIAWNATRLADGSGLLAIGHDITDREHARHEAQESAARYRALAMNLPVGIFEADRDGTCRFVNNRWDAITGSSSDAARGRSWTTIVHPADAARISAKWATDVAAGHDFDEEFRVGPREATRWVHGHAVALHADEDGGVDYLGTLTDITAFRQAQDEARHSDARLRALIETTRDGIVMIDGGGEITLFNEAAERMFGYARDEVMGKKVNILMPDPYASEHDGYIRRYQRTGEAMAIGRIRTVTGRRKSGEEFPMELSVTDLRTDGKTRYAALIRDISEALKLQHQKLGRERMVAIGTAAAKFAHEIGNPLNGMSVNAQLIARWLQRAEAPAEQRVLDRLAALLGDIRRLTDLLDEFRSLSRRERFVFEPTSIHKIVDDIIRNEAETYEKATIAVYNEVPHDLPSVPADADKIRRAVFNLCKNAVEAMPEGGSLRVRGCRTERGIAVEVEDTGVGIAGDLDVFEPFATSKATGTGLGLAIVRQITDGHNGTISYRSQPGRGTTFRLELPG